MIKKYLKNIVIVNPSAGNSRTEKVWPEIEVVLKKNIGSFKTLKTKFSGDAVILTRKALEEGATRIVAVGGDGHLNEVLNGFIKNDVQYNREATLTFLMSGTGCDFQRSLDIPRKFKNAALSLKNGKVRKIDIGKISYTTSDKKQEIRYFINIASFGLSGSVDHCVKNTRMRNYLGGPLLFLWATIKTVLTHPNQKISYCIDDEAPLEVKTRLCLLANGRYFGGGMHAAPKAQLDDGLMDLLILKEISLARLLWHLPKIYRGTHLSIPEIYFQKVRKFYASSSDRVILDVDGESPGYLEATFEILPKVLNLRI